jgi:hypothetical protein
VLGGTLGVDALGSTTGAVGFGSSDAPSVVVGSTGPAGGFDLLC